MPTFIPYSAMKAQSILLLFLILLVLPAISLRLVVITPQASSKHVKTFTSLSRSSISLPTSSTTTFMLRCDTISSCLQYASALEPSLSTLDVFINSPEYIQLLSSGLPLPRVLEGVVKGVHFKENKLTGGGMDARIVDYVKKRGLKVR